MISVICCTMRQPFMRNIIRNYRNQRWNEKELIIILNHDEMDINVWKQKYGWQPNISIYQLPQNVTLGECLNYGIGKAKYDIIAKFDDDDYYSPYYLSRSMRAFRKTDASLVGKKTVFMYFEKEKLLTIHDLGNENKYQDRRLKGATLLFKKEVCKKVKFLHLNRKEDDYFVEQCAKKNFRVYSC